MFLEEAGITVHGDHLFSSKKVKKLNEYALKSVSEK